MAARSRSSLAKHHRGGDVDKQASSLLARAALSSSDVANQRTERTGLGAPVEHVRVVVVGSTGPTGTESTCSVAIVSPDAFGLPIEKCRALAITGGVDPVGPALMAKPWL